MIGETRMDSFLSLKPKIEVLNNPILILRSVKNKRNHQNQTSSIFYTTTFTYSSLLSTNQVKPRITFFLSANCVNIYTHTKTSKFPEMWHVPEFTIITYDLKESIFILYVVTSVVVVFDRVKTDSVLRAFSSLTVTSSSSSLWSCTVFSWLT